ncbi:MAG TPA: hypothetical protein PK431_01660 [Chitinophagales bacterium]|nr:hypothetical protein [Chitinophagales bacterium]
MSSIPAILSHCVPIITAIIGTTIGWLLTRNKQAAEIEHLEIEDLKSLIGIWQKMAKDIRAEYVVLQKDFQYLKSENTKMVVQIKTLSGTIDTIKSENEKLSGLLKQIKKQQS